MSMGLHWGMRTRCFDARLASTGTPFSDHQDFFLVWVGSLVTCLRGFVVALTVGIGSSEGYLFPAGDYLYNIMGWHFFPRGKVLFLGNTCMVWSGGSSCTCHGIHGVICQGRSAVAC
jgi:hypothetical protein